MASYDAEGEEEVINLGGLQIAGWGNVTVVQAEQGLPPVVAVQYDANDKATMDLFAAVLKSGEVSERVFNLTTEVSAVMYYLLNLALHNEHKMKTVGPVRGRPCARAVPIQGRMTRRHVAGHLHQLSQLHCLGHAVALLGKPSRPLHAEGGCVSG